MKKILLVEDTRDLSEEIADALRLEGYDVTIAINALKALEILRTSRPDLIITDLHMPWMDGFEFIQYLRTLPLFMDTPIIILSANGSEENRVRGEKVGANAFLEKPCKVRALTGTIDSLLK